MLFQRFFKQPKPNKFAYTPVFYNERKEDLERKKRGAERDKKENKESYDSGQLRERLKKEMEMKRSKSLSNFRSRESKKSNRILVLILILLFAVVYIQFVG